MIQDKLFLEELEDESIEEAKTKHRRKLKKAPYDSVSYTTGDIGLNIDRFNTAMGTADTGDSEASEGAGLGESMLTEAKRYVRRYYVRPQNLFASNKAEILKILIELGNQNCSVYTLNNLGDDKDVSKLMNNDIIYYYDDGILYDKNRVKVMDYDLSIKKEEDRKKLTKVNDDSKEFKTEYEDRMTSATELEESQDELDDAFDLDFDDVDVYGESLTEAKHGDCSICGEPIDGTGKSPEPYMSADKGLCCSSCYLHFVAPMVQGEED